MSNEAEMNLTQDVKAVFGTPEGKRVLEFLKNQYVRNSSLCNVPEGTHYKLGQKEVVQMLINTVEGDIKDEQPTQVITEQESK